MSNPYQAERKRDAFNRVLNLLQVNPDRSNRILAQVLHVEAGVSQISANKIVRHARHAFQS